MEILEENVPLLNVSSRVHCLALCDTLEMVSHVQDQDQAQMQSQLVHCIVTSKLVYKRVSVGSKIEFQNCC